MTIAVRLAGSIAGGSVFDWLAVPLVILPSWVKIINNEAERLEKARKQQTRR